MYLQTVFSPMTLRPLVFDFPGTLTEDHTELLAWWGSQDEVLETSLIRAARRLLKPWLDGERRLNYAFCYEALDKIRNPVNQLITNTFGDPFEASHGESKMDAVQAEGSKTS